MKPSCFIATVVAGSSLGLAARDASAIGPVDVEVAAQGSFATNPSSTPANPLAFGLGARAGASALGFYAGADFAYYFGSGSATVSNYKVTERALKIGGDLGYGLKMGPMTVRPTLGVGDLVVSSSVNQIGPPCMCDILLPIVRPSTQHDLYVEGAVMALLPLGQWFVGADVELFVLPNPIDGSCCDELETSFAFGAQTGLRF